MGRAKSNSDPGHRSTLAEVAREAGVSIATASRILNGENKEVWKGSADRATRVRQIAREMGYAPDWRARALRGGRTDSVGVVYSGTNPMMDIASYRPLFRAFGEMLDPAGRHMIFIHVPRDAAGQMPGSLLRAVDAAVFYHKVSPGQLKAAAIVRGPSILLNCDYDAPYPRVNPDDAGGGAALARHLLELGHRRVVFADLCEPGADHDHFSRVVRLEAVRRAFGEAGHGEGFTVWRDRIGTPYAELVARWRGTPAKARPTAIVFAYGMLALPALTEFVRCGVRVPAELSIATFDDHPLFASAIVPMTTVSVPMAEMGRFAATTILQLVERPAAKAARLTLLPESLVVRDSTGRPAK